jgi:hypothetical protein
MNLHTPSLVLGIGSAVVIVLTARRLRPVAVEIAALGLHCGRTGRALLERQREHVEDLWAEVEDRLRQRAEERRRVRARQ